MGMYDYVFWNDGQYQTKSLDCKMDHYMVNIEGQLCKRLWDQIDAVADYEVMDYTGTIYVIDDGWIDCFDEYALLFVKGKLLTSLRVKWNPERRKYDVIEGLTDDQT